MGLLRWLKPAKRRFRTILISITAILITATIAYHNQIEYEPVVKSSLRRSSSLQSRPIQIQPISKNPLVCNRISNNESQADFNTFDIYKSEVGKAGGLVHRTTIAKKKEKLKVFVLPFTHVDPGWLRTFDSYSEDTNKILNNMHSFMTKNPSMTFMWAEFVFFERWWSNQTDSVKEDVRKLVKDGRFELASGSWVMTDEANAYYPVSVDNIVEGHQFLHKEFNMKPKVVWSNDPFGYSNSVPYLFSQAGLKYTVINRIHHGIKHYLQGKRAIPFKWRQYFDTDGSSDVWTHILPYTHYDILNSCGPNAGQCCEFDFKRMTHWSCPGPKPVPITKENVAQKAATLLNNLEQMSELYESNVLLMVHGDDFRFDMIEEWHQHHDNFLPVFEEINKGSRAEIRFGTFTDYFMALEEYYKKENKAPPTLSGDFFPYQCALGDYWTGYFTTRPFYKRQGRILHHMIRTADLLTAQIPLESSLLHEMESTLQSSRRTLALFQHHDAITGTSKKHVMDNYSQLLHAAINNTKQVIEKSIGGGTGGGEIYMIEHPEKYSETMTKKGISLKDGQTIFVRVYNPLPYHQEDIVSIRVDTLHVSVYSDGNLIDAQIEPYVHKGQIAVKSYLIVFRVRLYPSSFSFYELRYDGTPSKTTIATVTTTEQHRPNIEKALAEGFKVKVVNNSQFGLKTAKIQTTHDDVSGLIKEMTTSSGKTSLSQSFLAYIGSNGGAYLMRNNGNAKEWMENNLPRMLISGPMQQSIHLFSNKLYLRTTAKEVQGSKGEQLFMNVRIDLQGTQNTEVIMRLQTDWENNRFYVDSVGLQLLRREQYSGLGAAANYYPMPSAVVLENNHHRLTVTSNVEHGTMPMANGVEIMLDRMLNQDDGKGLGQDDDSIPNDLKPVDMDFVILIEKMKENQPIVEHSTSHTFGGHLAVQGLLYPPIVVVGSNPTPPADINVIAFPCDYQLLTVRPIENGKRLLIIYRNGAVCESNTAVLCGEELKEGLIELMKTMRVSSIQQTSLSGTEEIGEKYSIYNYEPKLEPYKFLALSLTLENS